MTVVDYYEPGSYNQMLADAAGEEPFTIVEPPVGLTVGPMFEPVAGEASETNETPKWLEEAEAALGSSHTTASPAEITDATPEGELETDSLSDEDAAWMQEAAEMNAEAELVAELTADREQLGDPPAEKAPQPVPDSVEAVEQEPQEPQEPTSENAEAQQEAGQANAAAREMLRSHLEEYMAKHGTEATYEGWIGELHPENVDSEGWIDPRLCLDGSEHRQIWLDTAVVTTSEEVAATSSDRGSEGDDDEGSNGAVDGGGDSGEGGSCAAEAVVGSLFDGMTAGTTLGFAAMHGMLGCGVEGLKAAQDKMTEASGDGNGGTPSPLHCMLRLMQGSLEAMDLCTQGAEHVTTHGLAAAGGASCGMLARSAHRAEQTHQRLRLTHNKLRWRNGPCGRRAWGSIKPVAIVC